MYLARVLSEVAGYLSTSLSRQFIQLSLEALTSCAAHNGTAATSS